MNKGTSKNGLTRRKFIQKAAVGGAAVAFPWVVPARALGLDGNVAPSDRITLGVIGYGPRCTHDLSCFLAEPDVHCIAICDVQSSRRQNGINAVNNQYGNKDCAGYRDLREMLARKDIDAVLIATGDRWHTPASVFAAKAGKDIYCEKPCAMTIVECQLLAETMHRYGRVYQSGTQRRSIGNFQVAIDLAHSGKLGKLHTLHAAQCFPETRFDWLPEEPEPSKDVCDWDIWLGPCPWRPYNHEYVAGGWRIHYELSAAANIPEWGAHTVDLCQWANKADETVPVEYEPTSSYISARYANGVTLLMDYLKTPFGDRSPQFRTHTGTCPVRFEGDEGWVETGDTGDIVVSPDSLNGEVKRLMVAQRQAGTDAGSHVRNFLDCVKSRARPHSHPEVTRHSHVACHAGAIAWLLNRKVTFDPKTEMFVNDEEANRLRSRAAREPWCL